MPLKKEEMTPEYSALQKYRRQRTIVKKIQELSKMRGLQINLLILNPKLNKIEEIYTDKCVSISAICDQIEQKNQ